MDQGRFHERVKDLRACAELFGTLAQGPAHVFRKDFRQAADLMACAAGDLETLVKTQPPGCICRLVRDDNYDYLDYVESCLHHHQLYMTIEKSRTHYAKMENTLRDKVRMKLIMAALQRPTAYSNDLYERAKLAIELADEVLQQLAAEVENS